MNAECCARLPAKYRNEYIQEIPELKDRVVQERAEVGSHVIYRCKDCGQLWEQHWAPHLHADVPVVVKAGVSPNLLP